MKTRTRAFAAAASAAVALLSARAIDAHHALARFFDTDQAITISGTIVRFERINPHSYMHVRQQTEREPVLWAVEAPAPNLLTRRTAGQGRLSPGDTVEACGYVLKEDSLNAAGERVLVAEIVETSDGEARLWSDYGNHHCRDQNRYALPDLD